MMPPSIQVCPVELPGRGRRTGEMAIADVRQLAEALAQALPLQVGLQHFMRTCLACIASDGYGRPNLQGSTSTHKQCLPQGVAFSVQDSGKPAPVMSNSSCVPQDKPYAFFGTCLGAIVAYETIQTVASSRAHPLPVAFFPAAVSPPHIYAHAVAKLYQAQGEVQQGQGMIAGVLDKLQQWRELPREVVMQVRGSKIRHAGCPNEQLASCIPTFLPGCQHVKYAPLAAVG